MRPVDLWHHSSFRLALGVTLFLSVTLMFASGVGFGVLQQQLAARQDARLTEIFTAIAQTTLQGDETDLIEAVTTRITASPDRTTAYLLKDTSGRILAGNITDPGLPGGWATVDAEALGVATDDDYRLFAGQAGPYTLMVGQTNADLDDLRAIVLGSFGWAALFVVLAMVTLGGTLAVRVQKRLTLSEIAVARLAQGDLSARLPVSARGDDLDRMAQAINGSLARLAASVEAVRQVSTDIAHDLRTPLQRLRIHIEQAADKVVPGSAVEADLTAAIAQSVAIDQTFAALLRIAQIEAGARRESFAPVDLGPLLQGVVEVYDAVAVDAGQSLTFDGGTSAVVLGDRALLTQCFANLIENAIRHCPVGTAIACTVQTGGLDVVACVRDNGPGIPADERAKVLRRLYRLEKSRSSAGSGLGLALVQAVVELHGGRLELTDAAPGLSVEIRLPQGRAAP